jgi:hypothetical protein
MNVEIAMRMPIIPAPSLHESHAPILAAHRGCVKRRARIIYLNRPHACFARLRMHGFP